MHYSQSANIENYTNPFTGPRPPDYFALLKAYEAPDLGNDNSAGQKYLKEYTRRKYYSIASAAGPLVTQLAVRLFKATATIFARSESQLQAIEGQTGKAQPRADAGGKAGKAKGMSTAKGGIIAAFKSAMSKLNASSGNGGRAATPHDDEDDSTFIAPGPSVCCSCKPVVRLEPA